jgi:replication factor C large subunit
VNSSDVRNEANMNTFLGSALGQRSLFFTPKVILIDEIDNISGTKDRGCIPALVKALEKSTFPVILTGNDFYDSKFSALRKACLQVEYAALDHKAVAQILQKVCTRENIAAEGKALSSLARKCDGDARAALIDLQTLSGADKVLKYEEINNLSDRKRMETIINALIKIFKSSSVDNALGALDDVDMDMNEIFLWLDENLSKEYLSPSALAKAYEHLSRADVFNNRIRRWQHWRFLVYINDLLTAGISSAKDKKSTEFVEYKPTSRVLKIWMANQKLAKKKAIAEKIAKATHTSAKEAFAQVPYFQVMLKKDGCVELIKELELNEEEAEWMRGE